MLQDWAKVGRIGAKIPRHVLRGALGDGAAKKACKDAINSVFLEAEQQGLIRKLAPFETIDRDYPELHALERAYPVIRDECDRLLAHRARLTDVEALGGSYTRGGIHAIRWKALMLKSGAFIEQNCELCPGTAAAIRRIPGVYTAFFSILEPGQYITPHWGYYRGFVRCHLAVVVPGGPDQKDCWLRINADPADNAARDKSAVERGEKYYWREGQCIVFDDTNLHDAMNGSDRVRVVLWLDVRRKMPHALDAFNRACLTVAHMDPAVRSIRKNVVPLRPDEMIGANGMGDARPDAAEPPRAAAG